MSGGLHDGSLGLKFEHAESQTSEQSEGPGFPPPRAMAAIPAAATPGKIYTRTEVFFSRKVALSAASLGLVGSNNLIL